MPSLDIKHDRFRLKKLRIIINVSILIIYLASKSHKRSNQSRASYKDVPLLLHRRANSRTVPLLLHRVELVIGMYHYYYIE